MHPRLPCSLQDLLKAALVSLSLATTAASAQPVTTLWYQSVSASGSVNATRQLVAGTDTFSFQQKAPGGVTLSVSSNTPYYEYNSLVLAPPEGQTFVTGPYENAAEASYRGALPGLSLSLYNGYCYPIASQRFVILEQAYDSNFEMVAFAANFERRCSDGSAVYGELRIGSSLPLTFNEPASAATPDAFAFPAQTGQIPGTKVVSNTTTIYGIRATAPISIVGGEYSLNGAAYTSAPGNASNRDHISVRVDASPSYGATTSASLTVGGQTAPFNVTTFVPGSPFTAVTLESEDPTHLASGGTAKAIDMRPPDWAVSAAVSYNNMVQVKVQGGYTAVNYFTFKAPFDAALSQGVFEEAVSQSDRSASPYISSSGFVPCSVVGGRFVIHEIELPVYPNTTVAKLAASFELKCSSGAPVFGEIRINSAVPLQPMVAGTDSNPDPFALKAQSPVKGGALVRSNWTTIGGISQAVPISITGGEYSINDGAYTSAPGTVQPHDHVMVQLTASTTPGTVNSAALTVGGRTETLTVTTYQPGTTLTGAYYRSTSGDPIGGGQTRLFLAPPSELVITTSGAISVAVTATGNRRVTVTMRGPNNSQLEPGVYENANTSNSALPGISVSTYPYGSSCYDSTGRFVIYEVVRAQNGSIQRLAADFEHLCNGSNAPMFGEIRFNSTVPFSAFNGECAQVANGTDGPASCTADLVVTQSASANPVGTGKDVVFTIEVKNNGPDTAYAPSANVSVDPSATPVWASPGCAGSAGSPFYVCTAPELASGATARFRIVLRRGTAGGTYSIVTTGTSSTDPISSNSLNRLDVNVVASAAGSAISRYRLYSPVTKEHHFTTDLNEYNVLGSFVGTWVQEGTVGKVLNNPGSYGGVTAIPYYRLYDTTTRWHHWTTDANEYYTLSVLYPNWSGEGVDGYILPTQATGSTQLYRLNYPYLGSLHHWTIDANEYNTLINSYGWVGEGGSGFVIQ